MSPTHSSGQSHRSASEIESDLADNRKRIEQKLEEVSAQFAPGRMLDQAIAYARRKQADGTTSRMQDAVVRNPLPVLVIGAGLAWLAFAGSQGSVPRRRSREPEYASDTRAEPPTAAGQSTSAGRPTPAGQSTPTGQPAHAGRPTPAGQPKPAGAPRTAEPSVRPSTPSRGPSAVQPTPTGDATRTPSTDRS